MRGWLGMWWVAVLGCLGGVLIGGEVVVLCRDEVRVVGRVNLINQEAVRELRESARWTR